jgi:hypothetical protein
MRKVERSEVVDYQTYTDQREAMQKRAFEVKKSRRVLVDPSLNFLFETAETVLYQVQEMMRVERIIREKDIQHELDTYNAILGDDGELGCTLLIEYDDPEVRDERLRALVRLPEHLYVELQDGTKVRPTFDPAQIGADRLSSVQYLKFKAGRGVPVAIGADHPELTVRQELTSDQQAALLADLRSDQAS